MAYTEPGGNTARHLHTLAALVSGIVGSRSTNLPAIAGKAPDRTKRESRVKRFSRWMKNERINAQVYLLPCADALLESLAANRTLLLAIDGSEAGRKCLVLMVSVIYKKRSLPIAWSVATNLILAFAGAAGVFAAVLALGLRPQARLEDIGGLIEPRPGPILDTVAQTLVVSKQGGRLSVALTGLQDTVRVGSVVLEDNGKVHFADDGKWGIGYVLTGVEPIGCHHLDKIAVP